VEAGEIVIEGKLIALQLLETSPGAAFAAQLIAHHVLANDSAWLPTQAFFDIAEYKLPMGRLKGLLGSRRDHNGGYLWLTGVILQKLLYREDTLKRVGVWIKKREKARHTCSESCGPVRCWSIVTDCLTKLPDTRVTIIQSVRDNFIPYSANRTRQSEC
jgi:hypothetical protein